MLIGAHTSASGGVYNAVERGVEIGAEAVQIFASSPRTWATKTISEADGDKFKAANDAANMGAPAIHSKYLLALGSSDAEMVRKSVDVLISDMQSAAAIGAVGVIFHPASHKGRGFEAVLGQFADALKEILSKSPEGPFLMMETSAGSGDHIGSKFAELGAILREVQHPQLAVCLDTAHVWAAGYDISQPATLKAMFDEFEREIGIANLKAVHANDSLKPLASAVDRHANIGLGEIGETGFLNFMKHPAVRDLPFYLEVPGLEKTGPDKPNVDTLKRLRAQI